MGYIGLGNRGDQVHDAFLEHGDQQTVAVCDLRDDYLDLAVKKSRATPKKYKEYKDLIEDKGVDAVVVAQVEERLLQRLGAAPWQAYAEHLHRCGALPRRRGGYGVEALHQLKQLLRKPRHLPRAGRSQASGQASSIRESNHRLR